MIIVNIKGGLGNQMFQYAFGRALADARGEELKLDLSGLALAAQHGDASRPFALNAFNVRYQKATPAEVAACRYPYGPLSRVSELLEVKLLRKLGLSSETRLAHSPTRQYFDGYWQSPSFFENARENLLRDFSLRAPMGDAAAALRDRIRSGPAVSVHVRRGDYASDPRVHRLFGTCPPAYYERAHAHLAPHTPRATYVVFSDDPAWAEQHIRLGDQAVYVADRNITDAESLVLMSTCNHHIIANSSFSWWGAWLDPRPEKIVIAPVPWFNIPTEHADLIPSSWITIPRNP